MAEPAPGQWNSRLLALHGTRPLPARRVSGQAIAGAFRNGGPRIPEMRF